MVKHCDWTQYSKRTFKLFVHFIQICAPTANADDADMEAF